MTTKQLGNAVRHYRKVREMTAIELSRKANISNSLLCKFEMGKTSIAIPTLCRLFTVLNVNIYFQDEFGMKNGLIIK